MQKPIYVVGPNGATLPLQNGRMIAIRPAAKGEKYSMALNDSGRFVRLEGQRINGVGVERFITNLGFIKAGVQDVNAARLTDKIAVHESIELVEQASQQYAQTLQDKFGGKRVTYVPFEAAKPLAVADIAISNGLFVVALGIGIGMSCGCVKVEYQTDATHRSEIPLSQGWIVGPDDDPAAMPRATAYGGLVETAAYLIANAGLATVSGPMEVNDEPADTDPFPRGRMRLTLTDLTGYIEIGIDGCDELVVQYLRADGSMVCERRGLEQMRSSRLCLGDAVGSIAAVLILARDQLAAHSTGSRR